MNNVNPLFQDILRAHIAPPTEQDQCAALELAMDPGNKMHTWLRFRIIGQYGTAEDLARFAEKVVN